MHGLKGANVGLDRKILSELAVVDPAAFTKVVSSAKVAKQV
jgi:large subunit ribosomal protein L20